MVRFLPFAFLATCTSLFGIVWIVYSVDPDTKPWKIFAVLVFLIFVFVFCALGMLLYFLRTKIYRRYSADWYFKTSFKMALYVAVFAALVAALAIMQLVTAFNLLLLIISVGLFAFWSYLGKKN